MIKSSSEDRSVIRRRPWCLLPGVLRSYLWTLLRFAYCNLIGFMEKFCRFELKCLQWSVWLLSSTFLGTRSWSLLHRQSCWTPTMLANVWWTFKTTLTPNRFLILIWTTLQFPWPFLPRYVMWLAIIPTYSWWTGLIFERPWASWSPQWMSRLEESQLNSFQHLPFLFHLPSLLQLTPESSGHQKRFLHK